MQTSRRQAPTLVPVDSTTWDQARGDVANMLSLHRVTDGNT